MSGTTAITSFSAMTTVSTTQLELMNPLIAELLPDLLDKSYKILNLLAPPDASDELVHSIVKELKTFGSRRARLLKILEDLFTVLRKSFGDQAFIMAQYVNRKLFRMEDPDFEHRPDAIIQAANLAIIIKDFLATERESRVMLRHLNVMNDKFPRPFLTNFVKGDPGHGDTSLHQATFNMALEIRTMYAIADLLAQSERDQWNPDELLVAYFFDSNTDHQSSAEAIQNGKLKNILCDGPSLSREEEALVLDRVESIRRTFRFEEDARNAGDLVDFDQLDRAFPWSKFLLNLVQWSRSRLDEITRGIRSQGGVEVITESIIEVVNNSDSQVGLVYDSPHSVVRPRQKAPAPEIPNFDDDDSEDEESPGPR